MLNSGTPFVLDMAKNNLQYGETNTQLGSFMEYNYRQKEWYSAIGFNHWYVAEGDSDINDPIDQSEDKQEDYIRQIRLYIDSDGKIEGTWGTMLGRNLFGTINTHTNLKKSTSSNSWEPLTIGLSLTVQI